jgi:hypothetical protein
MVARWQRRMLQAEFDRWRLHGVAWPLIALIDRWGSTVALAARRVTTRVLRASLVVRMVALAAAAVTVALVVVAIAQLV